jgi:hypothetical protein
MNDLDQNELAVHRLLSAVKPEPLPIGFRDSVMRQIRDDGAPAVWEWLVAAAFAIPGLAYLTWRLAANGGELLASLSSILTAAAGIDLGGSADVTVDGLAIMSFALVGVASVLAAHAMLRGTQPQSSRMVTR